MDSLATCPVKSTEMQLLTETIWEFWAITAGLLTHLPRSNSTVTLSSSQSYIFREPMAKVAMNLPGLSAFLALVMTPIS